MCGVHYLATIWFCSDMFHFLGLGWNILQGEFSFSEIPWHFIENHWSYVSDNFYQILFVWMARTLIQQEFASDQPPVQTIWLQWFQPIPSIFCLVTACSQNRVCRMDYFCSYRCHCINHAILIDYRQTIPTWILLGQTWAGSSLHCHGMLWFEHHFTWWLGMS